MFGRKTGGDVKKSAIKVLDPKKDPVTRLKHLRIVLDSYDVQEAKTFFEQNYSPIYYIFHDSFSTVEADLKQRANRSHREELDNVLFIFEKILTLLPDLIHKRWQYHSIGRLMKKLLHTGNSLKLRREGMRLFMLWYQVLMDNATDECHTTFSGLVPRLGGDDILDQDIFTVRTEEEDHHQNRQRAVSVYSNKSHYDSPVSAVEISPMLPPQSGEKNPENITQWLLDNLLNFMVSEVTKVEWGERERREFSFSFLFNKFKEHYLLSIFPQFSKDTNIYDPCLELPEWRRQAEVFPTRTSVVAVCQDVLVKWLATYTHCRKPELPPPQDTDIGNRPLEDPDNPPGDQLPGSNASTLSATSFTEKDITASPADESQDAESQQAATTTAKTSAAAVTHMHSERSENFAIVRSVLYGTRDNVNIVHEVYRQALLFPFAHAGAMRRVINVYKDWFHEESKDQRPVFMSEPKSADAGKSDGQQPSSAPPQAVSSAPITMSTTLSSSPSMPHCRPPPPSSHTRSPPAHHDVTDGNNPYANFVPPVKSESAPMDLCQSASSSSSRNVSYLEAVRLGSVTSGEMEMGSEVLSGLQRVLQVFITHSANVFLLEAEESSVLLDEQVDMCKRVLNIYRYIVMNHNLEKKTWEQLLMVLLLITSRVLTETPPAKRDRSLGGKLAPPLFQTLIVSWIKANLHVHISSELWDQFLKVLSSLTAWVELIKEWAKTMTTLTRVLARQVYGLDLNDLPLDRLSEQKKKRRGGATRPSQDISGGGGALRKRTFSRGWSRHESVDKQQAQQRHRSTPPTALFTGSIATGSIANTHTGLSATSALSNQPSSGATKAAVRSTSPLMEPTPPAAAPRHRLTSESEPGGREDMPGALIRSNSDSSLMVNMDSKGANEKEDTGSLAEEVLGMYYSAPEDVDDGDEEEEEDEVDEMEEGLDVSPLQTLSDDSSATALTDAAGRAKPSSQAPAQPMLPEDNDFLIPLKQSPQLQSKMADIKQKAKQSDLPHHRIVELMRKARSKSSASATPSSRPVSAKASSNGHRRAKSDSAYVPATQLKTVAELKARAESSGGGTDEDREEDVVTTTDPIERCLREELHVGNEDVVSTSPSQASTITDNASLNSMDSSNPQVPYQCIDTDSNSASLDRSSMHDRSDTEVLLRISTSGSSIGGAHASPWESPQGPGASSSPISARQRRQHRQTDSSLDTNTSLDLDTVTSPVLNGGSPTPDRESLRIDEEEVDDENATSPVIAVTKASTEANGVPHKSDPTSPVSNNREPDPPNVPLDRARSVLAGGAVLGWTADLAVILWRRMLGALGDINVTPPHIHAHILDCLADITDTLHKMRKNQGVTKDNQSSPEPPELIPPSWMVAPWVFEALSLPAEYKAGKLSAFRLLCTMVVKRADIELAPDECGRFFFALHHGLVATNDQDTVNVLVRHCGPRLFSTPLAGVTILIRDFLHAISTIVLDPDMKEAPRTEAVSMLGALLCFPEHFGEMPVLDPEHPDSLNVIQCPPELMLERIVTLILKASKKEPSVIARCVSISSLGLYLVQMLHTNPKHPKIKEAINVLMSTLKVNKTVAAVACDILVMLCEYVPVLLSELPDLPRWVIETITNTVQYLLPATEHSNADEDKRVLVSIMFCVLEWCLYVPLDILMDTSAGHRCLIYKVFRVLVQVVTGSSGQLTPRGSMAWQDFTASLQDDELDSVHESNSSLNSARSPVDPIREFASGPSRHGIPSASTSSPKHRLPGDENDALKLAARTVISHLVNHVSHFPMCGGAARLHSAAQEHHDASLHDPSMEGEDANMVDDLTDAIFDAPNVQFFVADNQTVISFVEIPAVPNVPGGGVTAGLTTGNSVCRVILREMAGRFCWDSCVLYGPPKCRAGSYPAEIEVCHTNDLALPAIKVNQEFEEIEVCRTNDLTLPAIKVDQELEEVEVCQTKDLTLPAITIGQESEVPQVVLQIIEDMDMIGGSSEVDVDRPIHTGPLMEEPSYCAFTRKPTELPQYDPNKPEDIDNLDELLSYMGHTSPECQLFSGEPLNIPGPAPVALSCPTQDQAMETLLHQADDEAEHTARHMHDVTASAWPLEPGPSLEGLGGLADAGDDFTAAGDAANSPFQLCRLFLNQLGFMQWGKRHQFDLLKKSDKLLRELKHFDNLKCRETHKVAVIYVGVGQEDKQSVLTNQGGSKAYEDFVSALGWEVDLEHHPGFMGGLQRNKSNGESMPYYATSTREVLFHVSTRMPSDTAEDRHRKLRHLGNDEVQIIWSEHTRDYRRHIIPTEFGDVLIIIYPLHNGLFRIHIDRKPEVPYFGPLFDGAVVQQRVLPVLVRATALNASQVLRNQNKYFQPFFEERARYVDSIIQHHKELTTFEDFSAQVFAPVLPQGDGTDGGGGGGGMENRGTSASLQQLTTDKHSPGNNRKPGKEAGGSGVGSDVVVSAPPVQAFHRRLSFGKAKKSVTKQMQAASRAAAAATASPPGSPSNSNRK